MNTLPDAAAEYSRTATFDEQSVPKKLLADHATKADTWGLIVLEAGELDYRIGDVTYRLVLGSPGVIPPQVPHHVTVVGPVRFYVAFYR